jgi:hypothetical protein
MPQTKLMHLIAMFRFFRQQGDQVKALPHQYRQ